MEGTAQVGIARRDNDKGAHPLAELGLTIDRIFKPGRAFALLALASLASVPLAGRADQPMDACAKCHGSALAGDQANGAPNLSVLPAWYVERQLRNYQRGLRGEDGGRHALDGDDLAAATAQVAGLPARSAAPVLGGDADRGSGLYRTCATCHGEQGEGNQAFNAPPVAGQNDWYLVRQLEHYQTGLRGGAPGDIWGAQMRASTAVLSGDDAVRDVVAYISTFAPKAEQ